MKVSKVSACEKDEDMLNDPCWSAEARCESMYAHHRMDKELSG